jgi:hypothetical protein
MKMDLNLFKKRAVTSNDSNQIGNGTDSPRNDEEVVDKIAAGSSSNLKKSAVGDFKEAGMDIIVDSDDEADIFDDDDEDDTRMSTRSTSVERNGGLNYQQMLAAGANALVAPVKQVINATSRDEEDTRDSDHSGAASDDDDEDDNDDDDSTESEDDEDKSKSNEKNGSDSGEDYTDDEDEGEDGYKPGGYHPVKIGEVYNQR